MVNSYYQTNQTIFNWFDFVQSDLITPTKPEALDKDQWPPDYRAIFAWRLQQLDKLRADKNYLRSAKAYYSTRPAEFIMHWMDTYDPRKKSTKWMPFIFFPRQQQFIEFIHELQQTGENGLVEKCRDAGVTWGGCAYSVWAWLFVSGFAIGWGSRKQDLVDKLGNPDSIFEKMRLIIGRLPDVFRPDRWEPKKHATYLKLINPENGSIIMGEAGDNIGRGGRTTMYFKDESAHYERPELIEAALGDNTNTQIDISSVNGLGNVFHRRREAGIDWQKGADIETGFVRVFVFDYSDHPEKTKGWYDRRKAKYEREGMSHIFAQEVERNYSAAVQNTIIPYEWIKECVDAHKRIKWKNDNGDIITGFTDTQIPDIWGAGLDVADSDKTGGIDRNALGIRQWIIWRDVQEWVSRDIGVTTRKAIAGLRGRKRVRVQYDIVGMGSSVKSEYNRLVDEKILGPKDVIFVPWNAGGGVQEPFARVVPGDDESPMNKDIFANMKAQAWVSLRTRFYKTFKNLTEGVLYPVDELISLDSQMSLLYQLMKELAQPTSGANGALKTVVEKKPKGTKSPNLADCGIQMFFPVVNNNQPLIGQYGG